MFSGFRVFSKLDLCQSYLQVPLHLASRNLMVFMTHMSVFRYARMPFGLSLAPSCFQKIMTTILAGLKAGGKFGRRDHLTRHLKKSHAQESGLVPLGTPSTPTAISTPATKCPGKEEPSPVTSDMVSASNEPMEPFSRDMYNSYPMASPVPRMAHPHSLMQGSLSSSMGVGRHMSPQPSHTLHHHLQAPAAPQQQPYTNVSRYQHGTTSYPRPDMDSFLLDLQSAPPPHVSTVNSSASASPQREVLGDGVSAGDDSHLLSRSPAVSSAELSCTTNVDLGPLLSFLPFSLPPYTLPLPN
ncbi:zinc finger protein PLAGL2-like [Pholidichthys leucotaenia]